ncbi:TIGR00269 family protein [Haloechinothrix sp. LS1_15]|uniref:TIGR00269 family protein n=1 Tax=Haloechinothrix sp. LS1_15 TaxID=2652248 RepID=UPI0029464FEF|nr:TIGR00269 family protein [Haloechinothrix sp. LS1_15]MDV6012409.1 TIGR00269 family protein [Haloechinothrix sp. LS1_15]
MKCRRCRADAVIELPQHRTAFCAECFLHHCRQQVRRTIEKYSMIGAGERPLMAISGGKDSLAAWDLLLDLGYDADGVYLGLGIGGYSDRSGEYARAFAHQRGVKLIELDLATDVGFTIPEAAAQRRTPCSACGLSKRHLLNTVALEHGYTVLVTGHNLDDEAAVLFGNVMRWDTEYLARQQPVLPGGDGFARRVKPLVRLGERETAAYCIIRRIDYQVEECPMAEGNRHLGYKELLNRMEERSPGTKLEFYNGFLRRMQPLLDGVSSQDKGDLGSCGRCGSPTTGELCAFCRLTDQATDPQHRSTPRGRRGRKRRNNSRRQVVGAG